MVSSVQSENLFWNIIL